MALTEITKVTGPGIHTLSNIVSHNINSSGIITATEFDGKFSGNIVGTAATFSGNVTIGGTLTYEDVTNIDSVGIITGKGADINGDLDVDGHTNLDNVSVAGVTTFSDNLRIIDGKKIQLGTSQDLEIYHSSNNSVVKNKTGNLTFMTTDSGEFAARFIQHGAVELYHDHVKRFETSSVGVSIPQDLDVDGHTNLDNVSIAGVSTFSDDVTFTTANGNNIYIDKSENSLKLGDSTYAKFGGAGELMMYHDGTYSVIKDTNSSPFNFEATGTITFAKAGLTETYAKMIPDGAVELYHNNSKRLETTNVGVTVTGELRPVGDLVMNTSDNLKIRLGASNDLNLEHNGSDSYITSNTGNFVIQHSNNSGDLEIKANDFYVKSYANEKYIRAQADGAVELYHDNVKRFETSSVGVSIPQDLDVDGHTNLDNVSIAGITTFSDRAYLTHDLTITGTAPRVIFTDTNNNSDYRINVDAGNFEVQDITNSFATRLRIDSSGNVKINAASESLGGKVIIKNNVNYNTTDFDDNPTLYLLNGDQTTGVSEAAIVFAGRNTSGSTFRAAISGNGSTGLKFYTTSNTELDDTPAMLINGIGNIGIGEANPSSDVTFTVRKDVAAASGNASIQINNLYQGTANASNQSGAEIEFKFKNHNAAHNWWGGRILCYNSDNYNQYSYLRFDTASQGNAVERMRLNHDGDLTIFGKDNAELKLKCGTSTGNNSLAFLNSSGTTTGNITYDSDNNFLFFNVNQGEKVRIASDGKVGIGENSPNALLHLSTGASTTCELRLQSNNTGSGSGDRGRISVYSALNNGTEYQCGYVDIDRSSGTDDIAHLLVALNDGSSVAERLRITSDGKVGINRNPPSWMLDIKNPNPGNDSKQPLQRWVNDGQNTLELNMYGGNVDQCQFAATNSEQTISFLTGRNTGSQVVSTETSLLVTQNRDLWNQGPDTNPYGGGLFIGRSASPYGNLCALRDSNCRPILYMAGKYPEITLAHEVPTNGSHAAVLRFVTYVQSTNTATGQQFTIGTNGPGNYLDIGHANAAQNANSHGGISNFQGTTRFRVTTSGCNVYGTFSVSSTKNFKISHPLSTKTETHDLVHSSIEGPQADLIYRGVVDLVDGTATVNVDTAGRMTQGTFEALCTNVSCFTSNETDWTAVKGSVTGNILTIIAQDNTSTATVSWMVVGERKDQGMIDSPATDDNGRLITEPLKSS